VCVCVCVCQVYYHLGAFEDSVTYALGADKLFNVNASTEYVETIVGRVDVMFITVPPVVVQSIAMSMSVCLSVHVCLYVHLHISETTCSNFTKFSVHVRCGRGSVLL